MTDVQWAVLEPLLPKEKKPGRPPMWARRRLIDGIRFRVRTGMPWRDMPAEYGPLPLAALTACQSRHSCCWAPISHAHGSSRRPTVRMLASHQPRWSVIEQPIHGEPQRSVVHA
ncbi:transposase [Streptomyces sp. P1-3]|uniref:transposase n=1 Tax=Streptomyces sp. P1-3 TaxID=3421658 RepID=UPI003D365CE3